MAFSEVVAATAAAAIGGGGGAAIFGADPRLSFFFVGGGGAAMLGNDPSLFPTILLTGDLFVAVPFTRPLVTFTLIFAL